MKRLRMVCAGLLLAFLGITLGLLGYYAHIVAREDSIYTEVSRLLKTHQYVRADTLFASHSYEPVSSVRRWFEYEWSGLESPQFLLLHGVVRAEMGKYKDALALLSHARMLCGGAPNVRVWLQNLFSASHCKEIRNEGPVRMGDIFIKSQMRDAINKAKEPYRDGILENPDDVDAVKALEWLLLIETTYLLDNATRDSSQSDELKQRGDPIFLLPQPPKLGKDQKRQGY